MKAPRTAIAKAATGLGLGAAASVVVGISDAPPWRIVTLGGTGMLVLLILACLTVAAGLSGVQALIVLAGTGFLAATALQLVQIGWTDANLLGGDGSTVALLLAFAVGLLALGLAPAAHRDAPDPSPSSSGRPDSP
ncbi:Rv1678 family membrane protein [Streptomyces sp. A5-4]|uniref:Rv1678 family membrane protein n=1 Tax=Streptomyces sp. A5-4 TaxID=3384771 RepID=UPI003DA7ED74